MIAFLLVLVIMGAVVGGLGRLALPGPDPMTIGQTILVGIGGSLLAGIVVSVLTGGHRGAGLVASVLGATLIVYLVRRSREGRAA
jgi:uncharacterized membrane protein YeaQ/YmgE (transglycosylase-associated protein family)